MQKTIKGYTAGFLTAILLISLGLTVYASAGSQSITVTYNNIRLVVNGERITPLDAQGHIVEPFIFNGTTFLPVRAVAEALGQDVHWDANSVTVYIGQVPTRPAVEVMLFDRPYLEVGNAAWFSASGDQRDNEIRITPIGGSQSWWHSRTQSNNQRRNHVVYALDMVASAFRGTLHPPTSNNVELVYNIYGDGRLLYTSPIIRSNTVPIPMDINVNGVIRLSIELEVNHVGGSNSFVSRSHIRGIENPRILTAPQ